MAIDDLMTSLVYVSVRSVRDLWVQSSDHVKFQETDGQTLLYFSTVFTNL
jgi:hypothetical protein